jgi:hypothetical protein
VGGQDAGEGVLHGSRIAGVEGGVDLVCSVQVSGVTQVGGDDVVQLVPHSFHGFLWRAGGGEFLLQQVAHGLAGDAEMAVLFGGEDIINYFFNIHQIFTAEHRLLPQSIAESAEKSFFNT